MTTELLDKPQSAVAEYQPFYAQLTELEKDNASLVFDYESKKGNKEARSHVFKLRQTKGALEAVRKQVKADILIKGRAIDSEKAAIEARIEAMIKVHQEKLDEIEQREADRIRAIDERIADIERVIDSRASVDLKARIAELEAIAIDDSFAEFIAGAAKAKDATITKYRAMLADAEKAEAEASELARLRAEAEARAQKDRDDAIAKAAEDRARAEAQAEAERVAKAAAQAIADAEAKAKAEAEAAARRELELKLQAEQAERRRVEAEQKAISDAEEAAARAEAEKQRAIQAEKDRVAALAKAEADAQAKREANKKHLAKINNAALDALVAGGLDAVAAKLAITLIASGKVPAVQINY
jgi:hypothetical protein